MISVSDFLTTVKPKVGSKLLPFKDDIIALKKANLSNKKICEFLKLNGVDVSHQRISMFLKEQGFNNKIQNPRLKADHRIQSSARENKRVREQEEFVRDNYTAEAEFVKPSWVPEHIEVEDLK